MNKKYILTIDQGTTSSRAILFDDLGHKVCSSQMEFRQITPKSGWVLHNPEEIYISVLEVIRETIDKSNVDPHLIKAIGITNQRETTVVWNKETMKEVYPAIVWQSRQSEAICNKLIEDGYQDLIQEKTGLLINPYFSASKIKWIFDNVKGTKEQAFEGKLLAGTIDTYLLYRLTNGTSFKTDYTNASRTMLFNIHELKWDQELLDIMGIPASMLPEVCDCASDFGTFKFRDIDIPICSMIGDQQASLVGHTAFKLGFSKITYGTGAFMLLNTKEKAYKSEHGLLTTIAYKIGDEIAYALEGSVFVAGSAVQWLRDGLKIVNKASDTEDYANAVNDSLGVYFVPAFVGLGSPYWDNKARGAIFGLSRGTTKDHIARATLEGIAYEAYDLLDAMSKDSGIKIDTIAVDGGASNNNFMMQFEADICNTRLIRPMELETTALGATYLAGLHIGVFKSLDEIKKLHEIEQMFMPSMDNDLRDELIKGWKKAVRACQEFE